MIADVKKNSSIAELKKYINYCISPKKETGNEPTAEKARRKELRKALKKSDRVTSERVAAFYSDEMEARPSQVDGFVQELDAWTISQKRGRPATAATPRALMGTFAWDPSDEITPERAVELTRESLMKEMGGSYRPGLFVCHQDTDHLHVHFVVAAVGADGLVYDPAGRGQLYRRMEMVMEGLETTHGFKRVQQRKAMAATDYTRAVVIAAPKGVDLQKAERTGKATPDMLLRARVVHAFAKNMGHMDDFLQALDRAGVRWKANVKEGRVAGLSFALANAPADHGVAAGKLGTAFAWGALSKTMNYDYALHFDMMRTHGREGAERLIEQGGKAPDMAEVPRRREPVPEAPVAPLVAPEETQAEEDARVIRDLLGNGFTDEDIEALVSVAKSENRTILEVLETPYEEPQIDYTTYMQEWAEAGARHSQDNGQRQKNDDYTRGGDYGFGY
jgi:hypothetical protein